MSAPGPKLAAWAKRVKAEAEARAKQKPTALLESLAKAGPKPPPLERALRSRTPSLVVEVRRKSLAGDWVDRELDAGEAAREASAGGAQALLVATDGAVHGAIDGDVKRAREAGLPVVRLEAVVHRHQLAEARVSGASGVTVHAALHDARALSGLLKAGVELGLAVVPLVSTVEEAHLVLDTGAALAIACLSDDDRPGEEAGRAEALLPVLVKAGTLVLARGRVETADDVSRLAGLGAEAVVVSDAFARAGDRAAFVRALRPG